MCGETCAHVDELAAVVLVPRRQVEPLHLQVGVEGGVLIVMPVGVLHVTGGLLPQTQLSRLAPQAIVGGVGVCLACLDVPSRPSWSFWMSC